MSTLWGWARVALGRMMETKGILVGQRKWSSCVKSQTYQVPWCCD